MREAHRDDFFSVPEDNPLKGLLQAADEATSPDSGSETACGKIRRAEKSNPATGAEIEKIEEVLL